MREQPKPPCAQAAVPPATLGMTPAMAAGVVNDFWTLDDLLAAL